MWNGAGGRCWWTVWTPTSVVPPSMASSSSSGTGTGRMGCTLTPVRATHDGAQKAACCCGSAAACVGRARGRVQTIAVDLVGRRVGASGRPGDCSLSQGTVGGRGRREHNVIRGGALSRGSVARRSVSGAGWARPLSGAQLLPPVARVGDLDADSPHRGRSSAAHEEARKHLRPCLDDLSTRPGALPMPVGPSTRARTVQSRGERPRRSGCGPLSAHASRSPSAPGEAAQGLCN